MNRDLFVERYGKVWSRAEALLDRLDAGRRLEHELAELPDLYRTACHHLALVRQRHYDAALETRLNLLALRGYHRLYGRRPPAVAAGVRFLAVDFPRLVRRHAATFWLATALFYLPMLASAGLIIDEPGVIFALLGPEDVAAFERMYRTAPSAERGSAADFEMFGFYIFNNVGIAFRTFAGGLLLGLGAIFFLIYNGLMFGAVWAHLVHAGGVDNLAIFAVTHGAFELTALVIAGVAGLRLGAALIAPGRRPRGDALRLEATVGVRLLLGAAAMLLVAAFLEAFWSSTAGVPAAAKLGVGAVAWTAVTLYLWRGGRTADGS